jgi:hypothetical protein
LNDDFKEEIIMIYRVKILNTRLLVEADNENEARDIACDYFYEECGLSFTTELFWVKELTDKELEQEYEYYRLQWMIDHNRTLPELIENLQSVRMELDDDSQLDEFTTDLYVFEEFEETGFSEGELWCCYNEWLDNEIIGREDDEE